MVGQCASQEHVFLLLLVVCVPPQRPGRCLLIVYSYPLYSEMMMVTIPHSVCRSTHWWRCVVQSRRGNGLQLLCRMSLDDMAEREMAKRKSSSSSKYSSASQKEFEDLVRAIPDPADEQDGLLADGACVLLLVLLLLWIMLFRDSQMAWILHSFRWHRYSSEIIYVVYAARDVAVLAMSLCVCVIMPHTPI